MNTFIDQGSPDGTYSFIQWKGTDVCMDFWCECGRDMHFDGFFAYTLECPGCGTVWEAPSYILYRKSKRDDEHVFITRDNPGWTEP